MSPDKIIVLVIGLFGIVATYWFFLRKKQTVFQATSDVVDIIVDGGYSPQTIAITRGKTTTLRFVRKDPSSCLEEVVLGDFKIKKTLPLHTPVTISITPKEKGTYRYACGMNMFHGTIVVS